MAKKDAVDKVDDQPTEVATVEATAVAAPSSGFQVETNQEDMLIPFLKVVQQLSDETTAGKDKYNAAVKAGDIYDGVTRTVYTGAEIIICGIKKYFAEWTPEIRGKLVGKHKPLSDVVINAIKVPQKSDKGVDYTTLETATGNHLIETYGVVCLIKHNGIALPAIFTLAKTSFMAGKSLNTLLVMHQQMGVPLFTFGTSITSNTKGSWYKPVFNFKGYEDDAATINMAQGLSSIVDKLLFSFHSAEVEDTTAPVAEENDLPI